MTTGTTDLAEVTGSSLPARWRIVGWMLLVSAISLATVAFAVRNMMLADVSQKANAAVVQEIEEFRAFAREGRDPQTAQPFSGVEPLLETYLRRQRVAEAEAFVGILPGGRSALEVVGTQVEQRDVPEPGEPLMRQMLDGARSGVVDTPAGEVRYGRERVTVAGQAGELLVLAYTRSALEAVDETSRRIFGVSLVAMLLTAGVAYVVSDRVLAPVRSVRQAAARIGEHDLSRRIPVQGRDDVAALAVTFNGMLDRLERAFDAERRFVDDAGHELRTPITVIRGHLENMPEDPAERSAATALVLDELDRMSRIVTDLLMLAKAERPDFVQLGAPVDLAELTVQLDHKVQALGERQWLLTDIAEGHAVIDAQRVTQAVLQLAHNAVRHTQLGGRIRLSSTLRTDPRLGDCVVLSVADDGPGVAPGDTERIFERFDRGSGPARRDDSGAGLGLAIVRAIAVGHRGAATVTSTPGQGARFDLTLPVRRDLLPDHPRAGAEPDADEPEEGDE